MASTTTTATTTKKPNTSRVAAHTHIIGLGLDEHGNVDPNASCGLIGQDDARVACGRLTLLIQQQKMAGKGILLAGPTGSGKTALALATAKELGKGTPFQPMVGSSVYSKEIPKTAVLAEYFRKAIGLRISETKEVYEGEVSQLSVEESEDPLQTYGRTISHVVLGLKTTKGSKILKLDPTMYENLQSEHIKVGDVIYIESNSGTCKRLGRSDSFAAEFDLEAEEYVPIPKGDVHKKKTIVQDVTLHDLDVANAHPKASKDVMSILNQMKKPAKTEITEKLRSEINKVVQKYCDEGIAELIPGVLFIDECHMLDQECFTYLNNSLESAFAPIVILATNRGMTTVTGTDEISPHGIPVDLLDRLLIVPTKTYQLEELRKIVQIRAHAEQLKLEEAALDKLSEIACNSLRYAVQLLAPAKVIAQTMGRSNIELADIDQIDDLFLDAKSSMEKLQNQS